MPTPRLPPFASFALLALAWTAQTALADGTPFFSTAQLAQGRWEYSQKCAVCHGAQLQGGGAPALKGGTFVAQWNGKTLKQFYGYVHDNMPLGQGGALSSQEYADIVAYILARSGLPAGSEKFTPRSPMERVLELDSAVAGRSEADNAGAAQVKIGELYGKLAQPSTTKPTQAELDAADGATDSWLMYNKGYRAERWSTLDRINDTATRRSSA